MKNWLRQIIGRFFLQQLPKRIILKNMNHFTEHIQNHNSRWTPYIYQNYHRFVKHSIFIMVFFSDPFKDSGHSFKFLYFIMHFLFISLFFILFLNIFFYICGKQKE